MLRLQVKVPRSRDFVQRMTCPIAAKKSCGSHLFWGGPKSVCSDDLRAGIIESHNSFALGPILVKFHIPTGLIESFATIFQTWWCAEEKLHFTPVHTFPQLKRDEALFPPLRRVVGFRALYRQTTRRRVSGGRQNLETVRPTV